MPGRFSTSPAYNSSHQTPINNNHTTRQENVDSIGSFHIVTPVEKSQNQLEGKDWEMAPTPPQLDQEQPKSPMSSPGLSLLLSHSAKRNATSPHMPRYRHVIPDQNTNGVQLFSPSKSPKSKLVFRDSNNFVENMEETESYDPLSKIEKLRRRLSLLKSQIKHSTQLISEGNNLLTSPNKNRSVTPKKQTTPSKSSSINVSQQNQDDDIFLLGKESFSTPSKNHKTISNPQDDSIRDNVPSTPSRKLSALTLSTGKKSPSSLKLLTPPTSVSKPKSPSSTKKRKINEMATNNSTPKTPSNKTLQNLITTPKSSHTKKATCTTTPHSKKKSPQVISTKFNSDEIFTPISKKLKKTTDLEESFNLDLFKTPTPVKPKNPHSIKINAILRRSLTQEEGETISRNIFEEEDDDFVFRERKKTCQIK
ncbi:predicted protein [Naegleria gruberi]|uniref:Predicted protein n=1 Tax=Naegleria gruberi TaxID=5762 RepID=D2UYD6_NAEGR|nr:uncharacterized protein NAEGRDRAFT_61434 [Naegleria gruberi]EFC50774.1 predicted protein [Naegleria gruberi]|eukprot:XP_002683518.1 predicted protein [Naegleria gruberi strain NEG-M]